MPRAVRQRARRSLRPPSAKFPPCGTASVGDPPRRGPAGARWRPSSFWPPPHRPGRWPYREGNGRAIVASGLRGKIRQDSAERTGLIAWRPRRAPRPRWKLRDDGGGRVDARLRDVDLLEAPLERCVLLDVLAVLVKRSSANAAELAAGERRLEQVSCVHGALALSGADHSMDLVDEQHDLSFRLLHLGEHSLEALLKLAAVLCTGDERAHDRIILGTAREDGHRTAHLVVAADDRIELSRASLGGQIARILVECLVRRLGRLGADSAAAAHLVRCCAETLGIKALGREGHPADALIRGECDEHVFTRQELVIERRALLVRRTH
eukprot:scaffold267624_cov22-Tisochrysis_lutea.AAC.3